ncbi:MAG: hypothetical protein HYT39_02675 [Candidatus Sungbacteria bacterium]|nr:hypothetical protein [Candidatus Sungbacteria bacterium]
MREEDLSAVVSHGESSLLKTDLNQAVMALAAAHESHFRPHVCLNGEDGVRVIGEIMPTSNTAFHLWHHMIASGDDVWLNIILCVYLNDFCIPTNLARLSPRQSAYVIANLPAESRTAVLAKAKRWYLERFLADIKKGLDTITKQFEHGDPLLESDHRNRILDLHGERFSMGIPYTETWVVGEQLFWATCYGGTMFEHEEDGFLRADELITARRERQKGTVEAVVGVFRGLERIKRGI